MTAHFELWKKEKKLIKNFIKAEMLMRSCAKSLSPICVSKRACEIEKVTFIGCILSHDIINNFTLNGLIKNTMKGPKYL